MRIAPEIGPNKVIAFSEKCPGSSQGKTTELSDTTFLMSGSKGLIEEQGGQQPNTKVWNISQDIEFFTLRVQQERDITFQSTIQGHEEAGGNGWDWKFRSASLYSTTR